MKDVVLLLVGMVVVACSMVAMAGVLYLAFNIARIWLQSL